MQMKQMMAAATVAVLAISGEPMADVPISMNTNPYQRPSSRGRKDSSKPKRWETPAAFAKRKRK